MILRSKNKAELILTCDAHDDEGFILRFGFNDFLDGDVFVAYLSAFTGDFYGDQGGVWERFKKKCKMIWCIITGREYRLKEIVLERDSFEELADLIDKYRKDINDKFPI